jgi:hypothetical protein
MKGNKCGFVSFDYLSECRMRHRLTVVERIGDCCPCALPFHSLGPLLKEYDEVFGGKDIAC